MTKSRAICGPSSAGLPNQAIGAQTCARLQHQNKLPSHTLKPIRAIFSVLIGKSSSDNGGKSMLVLWKGIETQRISVMGNHAIHYQLTYTFLKFQFQTSDLLVSN
ncbi:hypothetical protein D8674_002177 [Pyrus ussuriensis x Pyrus communis]|uniref:Uncharacterized protein n=1 Tax=Pyrus ussuriensis x Pyrus communis TaxID=2448454 RepID=A0A5N5FIY7_9ROSA|nr:hypothetical protein D8674_002177 [Pyrus ussuriensis x Pyrus communis]